jgi:glyoxylase-like metal-dependent hydrolase (beta-lactamase superfamily II)
VLPFGVLPKGENRVPIHCLLVETPASGLVLVDTGIGRQDYAESTSRLGLGFASLLRGGPEDTAIAQVEALGYRREDVRHLVVTHLDLDHAGGIHDFPHAALHVMRAERDVAIAPKGRDAVRYRPVQWSEHKNVHCYDPTDGERFHGFELVRNLVGLPPEISMMPLAGHTRGHACVVVHSNEGDRDVASDAAIWVHCGDAYFSRQSILGGRAPAILAHYERMLAVDKDAIARNHQRLGELQGVPGVRIFCAHDPIELQESQSWQRTQPSFAKRS